MTDPVGGIDATNPPSPKTIAASLVALIVPGLLAALMYLQSEQGQQLYDSLPVLVVVGVKSLITGLITLVVAHRVVDPQRIIDLATSPKVIWATIVAVLLTALTDVVGYLATPEGQTLYENWNPILVVALAAIIPAAGTFLAGFLVSDPARRTSKNPHPVATEPPPPAGQPIT